MLLLKFYIEIRLFWLLIFAGAKISQIILAVEVSWPKEKNGVDHGRLEFERMMIQDWEGEISVCPPICHAILC